ncbi:MAG: hypothetical protein AAB483_02210 [Patescibacteria group bacterium]
MAVLPSFEETENIGQFIKSLYNLGIGFVGLAVFIQFFRAGLSYLFAAGNAGETTKAREMMQNAVLGAILLLSSYLILNVINPDLVKTDVFDLNAIKEKMGPVPSPGELSGDPIDDGAQVVEQLKTQKNIEIEGGFSLSGMSSGTVRDLQRIAQVCKTRDDSCVMTVVAYWQKSVDHADGGITLPPGNKVTVKFSTNFLFADWNRSPWGEKTTINGKIVGATVPNPGGALPGVYVVNQSSGNSTSGPWDVYFP